MTKRKGLNTLLNREDAKGAKRFNRPLGVLRVFAVKFWMPGSSTSRLNIQIPDRLGMGLDKASAGIHRIAHEHVEGPV